MKLNVNHHVKFVFNVAFGETLFQSAVPQCHHVVTDC